MVVLLGFPFENVSSFVMGKPNKLLFHCIVKYSECLCRYSIFLIVLFLISVLKQQSLQTVFNKLP